MNKNFSLALLCSVISTSSAYANNIEPLINSVKEGVNTKTANVAFIGENKNEKLIQAIADNDINKVHELLNKNYDVNIKDTMGNTPLMKSAQNGNLDIAEALIKKGANVQAINNNGETAVYLAKANNKNIMAEYLESVVNDVNVKKLSSKPDPSSSLANSIRFLSGTTALGIIALGLNQYNDINSDNTVIKPLKSNEKNSTGVQDNNVNEVNSPNMVIKPLTNNEKNSTGENVKIAIIDNGVVTNNSNYLNYESRITQERGEIEPLMMDGFTYFNNRNNNQQENDGERIVISDLKDFTSSQDPDNETGDNEGYYHATQVATVINDISPDANFQSLRAISSTNNTQWPFRLNVKPIEAAINYALNNGSKVINNSWGTSMAAKNGSRSMGVDESYYPTEAAFLNMEIKDVLNNFDVSNHDETPLFVWSAGNNSTPQKRFSPSEESGWYLLTDNQKWKYNWLTVVALEESQAKLGTYTLNSTSNACGTSVQGRCIGAIANDTSKASAQVSGAAAKLIAIGLTPDRAAERILATADYINADGTVTPYTKKRCTTNSDGYIECPTNNLTGAGMINKDLAFSPLGTQLVIIQGTNDNRALFSGSSLSLPAFFGNGLANSGISFDVVDNNGGVDSQLGSIKFSAKLANYVNRQNSYFNIEDAFAEFGEDLFKEYLQVSEVLSIAYKDMPNNSDDTSKLGQINNPSYSSDYNSKMAKNSDSKLSLKYSSSKVDYALNYNVGAQESFNYSAFDDIKSNRLLGKYNMANPYLAFADSANSFALNYNLGKNSKIKLGFFEGKDKLTGNVSSGFVAEVMQKYRDKISLSLQIGNLKEKNTLLGAKGNQALGLGKDTPTDFIGIGGQYKLGNDISLFANYNYGVTKANLEANLLVNNISDITSESFTLGISKANVIDDNDNMSLSISQPLRVTSGTISFAGYGSADLAADGRELDFEAGYSKQFGEDKSIYLGGIYRIQPDNIKEAQDDKTLVVKYKDKF